jgi:hypothetical protein
MNKAITVEKVCQSGYTLGSDGWCRQPGQGEYDGDRPRCPPGSVDTVDDKCAKVEPITCPAGQTFHLVYTSQFEGHIICVPNSVVLTPSNFDPTNPRNFPCASNELFSNTTNQCIPPASSPASPSPVNNMNLSEAEATYQTQLQDYETSITTALANRDVSKLPEIRAKAEAIQATLNKMIEELTYLKKETPNIRIQRDKLIANLQRIQKDYNAMLVNTDDLETLRRIRQQESGEARRELFMYIGFFLVLAIVILLFLIFMSPSQKKDMTTSTPNTPAISPALT